MVGEAKQEGVVVTEACDCPLHEGVVSIIMMPVCLVAVISPRPIAMVSALLLRPIKSAEVTPLGLIYLQGSRSLG